jgi:hypothetical protein
VHLFYQRMRNIERQIMQFQQREAEAYMSLRSVENKLASFPKKSFAESLHPFGALYRTFLSWSQTCPFLTFVDLEIS